MTLKLHRFELGLASAALVAVALWALAVIARLASMNVPAACLDAWVAASGQLTGPCVAPVRAWGGLLESEGTRIVAAMNFLPLAVGLLGGVPIVAREIEGRTAQTAWSLEGARVRWLFRQLVPVALLLGALVVFAGLGAGVLQRDRETWGEPAVLHIGEHGWAVLPRALAGLGIGLLVGALVGRSLPAFVMGAVLCFGLVQGVSVARDSWLSAQPAHVITDTVADVQTGWAWQGPNGVILSETEAFAHVPAEVAERDAELVQAIHSLEWLESEGFIAVAVGVRTESALAWALYDAALFAAVGVVAVVASAAVVSRRRPI